MKTGTAQGKRVTFAGSRGTTTLNGATAAKASVDCTNGMVRATDAVLLPPQ